METPQSIRVWADETFGVGTMLRRTQRVAEEVFEAFNELDRSMAQEFGHPNYRAIGIELADCLITLCGVNPQLDIEKCPPRLWAFVEFKMTINRTRTWERDGQGCGYHVE